MVNLSALHRIAEENCIEIDRLAMKRAEALSLPLPGGGFGIAIDPARVRNTADELVKTAHEMGHCMTGSFYNRHAAYDLREKQEHRADKWAILALITADALDEAVALGNTEIWMLAEYFGVTEEFMRLAVCYHTHGHLAAELLF